MSRQDEMVGLVNDYLTPEEQFEAVQEERKRGRKYWAIYSERHPEGLKRINKRKYKNNPNYQSEAVMNRMRLRKEYITNGAKCAVCAEDDISLLEIHHIDPNDGDEPNNIEIRCVRHHRDAKDGIHSSFEWWQEHRDGSLTK
jgi:hypothetical protein